MPSLVLIQPEQRIIVQPLQWQFKFPQFVVWIVAVLVQQRLQFVRVVTIGFQSAIQQPDVFGRMRDDLEWQPLGGRRRLHVALRLYRV